MGEIPRLAGGRPRHNILLRSGRRLGILIVLALPGLPLSADVLDIRFEKPGEPLSITAAGEYIVDPDAAADFESMRKQFRENAGLPVGEDELYLGSMQGAVWFRFQFSNHSSARHMVLEVANPRLLEVDLYDANTDRVIEKRAGASRPFYAREILFPAPAFMIAIPPGADREYYLRVANTGDMRVSARVWTHEDFDYSSVRGMLPDLVLAGVLLAYALYHVFMWLAIRRIVYLMIAVLVVSFGLLSAAINGTGPMLLWPNWPWYAERAISIPTFLTSGAGILFVAFYLEIWRYSRRAWQLALAVAAFCFLGLAVAVTTDHLLRMQLMRMAGGMGPVVGLVLMCVAIYNRQRSGWYLLVIWGFTTCIGVLMVLAGMGLVTSTLLNGRIFSLVFLGAILVWSFELAGRIRKRELEIRGKLETQVEVTASELESALDEVKTLSGLLPICGHCKKIRDDRGYWSTVEHYLRRHTEADFTHGICPDCMKEHFPDYSK